MNYDDKVNDEGNTNNIEDSSPKDGGIPNQHEGNTNEAKAIQTTHNGR